MSSSSPQQNARLASHVPMVLMTDIDRREADSFDARVVQLLEDIMHPRYIERAKPYITFLTALVYYSVSLSAPDKSTPGQSFCNLDMVTDSLRGENRVYHGLEQKTFLALSVWMALIPSIDVMLSNHVPVLRAFFATLVADDSDPISSEHGEERSNISDAETPSIASAIAAHEVALADDGIKARTIRFFARCAQSLGRSYTDLVSSSSSFSSSSGTVGGMPLMSLLQDFHYCLFTMYGMYYNPALRFTGVKLMENISRKSVSKMTSKKGISVSLKVLGWMLGFRLLLLAYHGVRTFHGNYINTAADSDSVKREKIAIRNKEGTKKGSTDGTEDHQDPFSALDSQNSAMVEFSVHGMENKECPLCMEKLHVSVF